MLRIGFHNWPFRVPMPRHLIQQLTSIDLSQIPYYHFVTGELAGVKDVIISNSGYTGAGGFELYMYNEDGPKYGKSFLKQERRWECSLPDWLPEIP